MCTSTARQRHLFELEPKCTNDVINKLHFSVCVLEVHSPWRVIVSSRVYVLHCDAALRSKYQQSEELDMSKPVMQTHYRCSPGMFAVTSHLGCTDRRTCAQLLLNALPERHKGPGSYVATDVYSSHSWSLHTTVVEGELPRRELRLCVCN